MTQASFTGLHRHNLTGYLFGLLLDCVASGACAERRCALRDCWQVDLVTTLIYLRSLPREDRMLLLHKYERCSSRSRACAAYGPPERRARGLPGRLLH